MLFMGRYFVRGRSPGGGITTERVFAPDAKAALGKLSARGYTELELLSSAFEAAPVLQEEEKLLADEQGINVLADAYLGAYSSLGYAALGDRESALREIRAAESWLEPHDLDGLLERCRVAARDG